MSASIAQALSSFSAKLRKRLSRANPDHLERGARGEKLACRYLRRNGYKILYRNFRGRSGGEIDIVARDGDTLVFIEVKTRSREDFGRPLEAIGTDQQQRISAVPSPGSGCSITPISSSASTSWKW
jgi:putative endonuclease